MAGGLEVAGCQRQAFQAEGCLARGPEGAHQGTWTVSLALCWDKSLGQAGKGLGDQAGKSGDFSQEWRTQ